VPKQSQEVTLLDYWYAVLELEAGISISTKPEDKELLKQQLYRARSEAGDERLNALSIITPKGRTSFGL